MQWKSDQSARNLCAASVSDINSSAVRRAVLRAQLTQCPPTALRPETQWRYECPPCPVRNWFNYRDVYSRRATCVACVLVWCIYIRLSDSPSDSIVWFDAVDLCAGPIGRKIATSIANRPPRRGENCALDTRTSRKCGAPNVDNTECNRNQLLGERDEQRVACLGGYK